MNADFALHLMSDLLATGLMLLAPLLSLVLLTGLATGVLQTLTQVQDVSLAVIPKLVVAAAVLLATGPWMLRILGQFTGRLWGGIPSLFA